MADDDSSEERSEDATPRRQEEARKRGQVARSRDLAMTLSLVAGSGSLLMFAPRMMDAVLHIMRENLVVSRAELFEPRTLPLHLADALWLAAHALFWPLAIMFLASIAGSVLLGGFMFSTEALLPKWERIDPMKGLGRMFSSRALLELAKALAKFFLVSFCCILILRHHRDELLGLGHESMPHVFVHMASLLLWAFLWMTASLLLVALIDAPAQWFTFMRELRMTRQEIKEEYKDSEGRPEVKARMRQMQRKMAEARMMAKLPQADVVITNPTHYAVAIRYKPEKDAAPILLAKGTDHMALQIRKLAKEHKIVMVEAPPLARSIYHTTDIDREIPAGLYMAVARILAWLHGLRLYQAGKGRHPGKTPIVDIPEDLRRDA